MNDAPSPQPPQREETASLSHSDQPLSHDEVRHEPAEIPLAGVLVVLLAFAAVFVAVALVSDWVLVGNSEATGEAKQTATYTTPSDARPPEPRLEPLDYETAVAANVFKAQIEKEHTLNSYGATEEEAYVHIPIDEAMKLAVKSMPVQQGAEKLPEKSFGLVGGGEANSGRQYAEAPEWLQQQK